MSTAFFGLQSNVPAFFGATRVHLPFSSCASIEHAVVFAVLKLCVPRIHLGIEFKNLTTLDAMALDELRRVRNMNA